MANQADRTPAYVLVAIDIAKQWNAALVEYPDGRRQRFQFRHAREDYDRLVKLLRDSGSACRIAFEPTGVYHWALAYRLLQEGFEVCQVSVVAAARYRDAMFNSWDKNDPKDAQVILELLKQGVTQRYHDPLINHTHDLEEISKTYELISRARTRLRHGIITHYLPLHLLEIERFWYSSRNDWFVRFLMQFPTAAAVSAFCREDFVAAAWEVAGRKVGKRRQLEEIHELAQNSIALPLAADSVAVETFRLQLSRYDALNEQRTHLLTDLRMQFLQARPLLFRRAPRGEYVRGSLVQLRAPLRDLVRMYIESFGKLGQGFFALQGSQGHFGLEGQ